MDVGYKNRLKCILPKPIFCTITFPVGRCRNKNITEPGEPNKFKCENDLSKTLINCKPLGMRGNYDDMEVSVKAPPRKGCTFVLFPLQSAAGIIKLNFYITDYQNQSKKV